jgi:hypothetical protein
MPQQDHHRQRASEAPDVKPFEHPILEKHTRMGEANKQSAPAEEKEKGCEPDLPVKNGRTGATKLRAPVANPRKERDWDHEKGNDDEMQDSSLKERIAPEDGEKKKKKRRREQTVVEVGSNSMEHECFVEVIDEFYGDYNHPFLSEIHEDSGNRSGIIEEQLGGWEGGLMTQPDPALPHKTGQAKITCQGESCFLG